MMKHAKALLGLTLGASLLAAGVAVAQQQTPPLPRHVAGKIVNVSHQRVMVNNQWLDKVEVGVESCTAPGKIDVVNYDPSTVTDRNPLAHLFEENLQSDRTPDMKQQQLPGGYGVFWVDEKNNVQRTGLLGSKLDCSVVPTILQQFK